jgi:hypothetical protein
MTRERQLKLKDVCGCSGLKYIIPENLVSLGKALSQFIIARQKKAYPSLLFKSGRVTAILRRIVLLGQIHFTFQKILKLILVYPRWFDANKTQKTISDLRPMRSIYNLSSIYFEFNENARNTNNHWLTPITPP